MTHCLSELERRLADELLLLNLPAKPWLRPTRVDGRDVLDVAVIGGGLCGLVVLAALRLAGVENVQAFDRAAQGREGPWVTYARMQTLRTAKEAAGPALGIPSLGFRAWFEAQFGRAAFESMAQIPREQWMEYLNWYRKVLRLPVLNDTELVATELRSDGLIGLRLGSAAGESYRLARRVVLATGLDGMGAPWLPEVAARVPARFVAHSADRFDMAALAGKRVAVVGAGASAMDNAAAALEAGAARVDLFIRRDDIPRVEKFSGTGSIGVTHGFVGLPDAYKWQVMREGERAQIPPPRHSVLRVSRHANAYFHLGSPVLDLLERDDAVEVVTPKGRYRSDKLIFATGFAIDIASRPEFAGFSAHIRRWSDAYQPAPEQADAKLAASPYLGPNFEFLPRSPDDALAAAVSHIHCFAYPAVLSHGKLTSGIPAVSHGAQRLVRGLVRSLFVEDREHYLDTFIGYATPELLGDEWRDADQALEAGHDPN